MPLMLLCLDLPVAHQQLTSGDLRCPHAGCTGQLRPWGSARARTVRARADAVEQYIPRRARRHAYRGTHVLASARTFPHRPDTVGAALLASISGLGHRRVVDQLGLPATTVRGWLRQARADQHDTWSTTTRRAIELDPMTDPFTPAELPLVAVGQAIAAYVRRFGPVAEPWSVAVLATHGRLLAPPDPRTRRHPPDST